MEAAYAAFSAPMVISYDMHDWDELPICDVQYMNGKEVWRRV